MNSLIHTLSAVVSGAFLLLGFERLAEAFDPVTQSGGASLLPKLDAAMPCAACLVPSDYSVGR
ncbi:MAG: hypothetical protein IAE82_18380 [Opitutaceae bacterium]|nr:hypothetical protein [Opitutaceae bacterium]